MNFTSAIGKLRKDGPRAIIQRRLKWYRDRVKGTLVALKGNRVYFDDMVYSVEPFSSTLKCAIAAGNFEEPERALVKRWLPSDLPVVEFGGGMGVVSCLANRKLSDAKRHVVVEANPAMIPLLSFNRDLNGCQFAVVNRALAYDTDTIRIDIDPDFVGSSVFEVPGKNGEATVATTTLADIMEEYGFEQCGVVCDIEGLEVDLVERELPLLGGRVRYFLAETHPFITGRESTDRLLSTLRTLGFSEKERIGICVFYSRD
jgi:FkbM family methyltransferase